MKKTKITIMALLLCLIMTMSACTSNRPIVNPGNKLAGNLNITIFGGGYDIKWLTAIAAEYKKKNPRVNIKVRPTPEPASEISNIEAGTSSYDMLFMVDVMNGLADRKLLADITDVYQYVEEGQDKTVEQRMHPLDVEYFKKDDGTFSLMPWSNSREGLIYNNTVAKEIYPDGMKLPRTTDEMFEIFDDIKSKGYYAFNFSGKNDYAPYFFTPFWAQYEGLQNFNDFYDGWVTENGVTRKATSGKDFIQVGRLKAWEICEKMQLGTNGYAPKYAKDMGFMEAQTAFLGHGFADDSKKSVFALNGEWLENEADFAMVCNGVRQEIKYAKTPVMSSVREKTPTITSDAMLREVVDFVDGTTTTKPANVSDSDIEWIKTARRMVNSVGTDHSLAINGKSKSIPLAKDFLKYMTTKEAGRIYSKTLGGMVLPYGSFDPRTDSSITLSEYQKTKMELFEDCLPMHGRRDTTLVYRFGHTAFREKWGVEFNKGTWNAESIYKANNDYFSQNWDTMKKYIVEPKIK